MEKIDKIGLPDVVLSGKQRETLIDKLLDIARDGFGSEITRDDVENHVLKTDALYLIRKNNDLVGFASYDTFNVGGEHVLYLHGIVVKKDFQKKGVFHRTNEHVLSERDFDFLVMRTQNPVVYVATGKLVRELYPNQEQTPKPIKDMASVIAKNFLKMERYSEETHVEKGTYGCCLSGKVPRYEPECHYSNDFFDNALKLDYSAGDSVLLVGNLKEPKKLVVPSNDNYFEFG